MGVACQADVAGLPWPLAAEQGLQCSCAMLCQCICDICMHAPYGPALPPRIHAAKLQVATPGPPLHAACNMPCLNNFDNTQDNFRQAHATCLRLDARQGWLGATISAETNADIATMQQQHTTKVNISSHANGSYTGGSPHKGSAQPAGDGSC